VKDPQSDPLAEYGHLLPQGIQPHKPFELKPRPTASRAGGIAGIGAVLLALILKFKTVLLFLANFKWIAIGAKFLLSFGSLILSIGLWAQIFGFWFATGFVLLILVHELGHVIAIRAYGLQSSMPIFIPFFGAFVALKEMPPNSKATAVIALAGPLLGTVGALACYLIGLQTGVPIWYALASTAFFINLFNLIPIFPLDGGRVVVASWSKIAPMSIGERWLTVASLVGLAAFLLIMWRVAGAAVAPHG
jgi:Zn-dependent protease